MTKKVLGSKEIRLSLPCCLGGSGKWCSCHSDEGIRVRLRVIDDGFGYIDLEVTGDDPEAVAEAKLILGLE